MASVAHLQNIQIKYIAYINIYIYVYANTYMCEYIYIISQSTQRVKKNLKKHDVSKVSTSFTETSNDSGIVLEW